MTDLEYIKAWLSDDYAMENTLSDRDIEVLESVAKKLEELPSRRKEAKRFRMKYINYRNLYEKTKREQGEWLKHESLMEYECICSKCNKDALDFIGVDNTEMAFVAKDMNYCPNCGAEMKGGAEE